MATPQPAMTGVRTAWRTVSLTARIEQNYCTAALPGTSTASSNTHLARYSRRVICLTDCRSGRPRVCRSPYGQHRTAGIDNIRAVDEAGMMPGLTSVPAAARGVRGRSRLEGVVLTWRGSDADGVTENPVKRVQEMLHAPKSIGTLDNMC